MCVFIWYFVHEAALNLSTQLFVQVKLPGCTLWRVCVCETVQSCSNQNTHKRLILYLQATWHIKLFTVCVVTRFSFGCPPGCLMKINSHGVSLNLLLLSPIVQALYSVTLQTLEQISFKSHKYNMSYIITYQNMLIYYILKSKEIHVMESIGKNLNR